MVMRRIVCSVLAMLFSVLSPAGWGQVVWQNRSLEELAGMIRAFEGDPNLELTEVPIEYVERDTPPPEIDPELFVFEGWVKFQAGHYEYSTSQLWPGFLTREDLQFEEDRDAFYGEPYAPAGWGNRAMSAESARAIAESFMQTHYPEPQLLTCTSVGGIHADPAPDAPLNELCPDFISMYAVWFRQMLPNGVEGPNTCLVTVDSVFGRIVYYHQRNYPIVVSTTPVLSAEDAMGVTLGIFPGKVPSAVVRLRVTTPDEFGLQRLLYYALVEDPPGTFLPRLYGAEIDAHDGSLYSRHEYMGGGGGPVKGLACAMERVRRRKPVRLPTVECNLSLSIPPVLVKGRPYLYVGYLAQGNPIRAKRYEAGGRVTVGSRVGSVCFRAGSCVWSVDGRERTLSSPAVIIAGRMYVPVEAFKGIVFRSATYDRAHRRLTCEVIGKRTIGRASP